jgi:hypothetical protein
MAGSGCDPHPLSRLSGRGGCCNAESLCQRLGSRLLNRITGLRIRNKLDFSKVSRNHKKTVERWMFGVQDAPFESPNFPLRVIVYNFE